MTALTAVFAGLLGAAVGSFANVVVYRVPRRMSLLRPPSSCPACGSTIRSRDNLPVLSYLMLRGRCRSCGERISPRYPLVEAAAVAVWVGAALRFELEAAAFVAVASTVLGVLALIDMEHRRIPNVVVLPSTAAAAMWVTGVAVATNDWRMGVRSIACGAGFFALLLVVALLSGAMGFGDVKLGALIGIVTGRFGVGVAVAGALGGFIVGGVVAVALLASGRRRRTDAIPFGPSLAIGAMAAMFGGEGLVRSWLGL